MLYSLFIIHYSGVQQLLVLLGAPSADPKERRVTIQGIVIVVDRGIGEEDPLLLVLEGDLSKLFDGQNTIRDMIPSGFTTY